MRINIVSLLGLIATGLELILIIALRERLIGIYEELGGELPQITKIALNPSFQGVWVLVLGFLFSLGIVETSQSSVRSLVLIWWVILIGMTVLNVYALASPMFRLFPLVGP